MKSETSSPLAVDAFKSSLFSLLFQEKKTKKILLQNPLFSWASTAPSSLPECFIRQTKKNKREKLRSYLDCQVSAPPRPWFWIGFLMISLLAICFEVRAPFFTCSLEVWWMAASFPCPCFFWKSPLRVCFSKSLLRSPLSFGLAWVCLKPCHSFPLCEARWLAPLDLLFHFSSIRKLKNLAKSANVTVFSSFVPIVHSRWNR